MKVLQDGPQACVVMSAKHKSVAVRRVIDVLGARDLLAAFGND